MAQNIQDFLNFWNEKEKKNGLKLREFYAFGSNLIRCTRCKQVTQWPTRSDDLDYTLGREGGIFVQFCKNLNSRA